MAENFEFVGFDGKSYSLPSLPGEVDDFGHYIIFYNSSTRVFFLVPFNCNVEVSLNSNLYVTVDDGIFGTYYRISLSNLSSGWISKTLYPPFSVGDSTVLYSCKDLFQFKEEFKTMNFYLDASSIESTSFTLKPIVEQINTDYYMVKSVFGEVFSILPVLIVVIIGFIGIRKGISFLISQIRKC